MDRKKRFKKIFRHFFALKLSFEHLMALQMIKKIFEHRTNSEHGKNRTCLLLDYFDELGRFLVIKSRLQLDKKLKNPLNYV